MYDYYYYDAGLLVGLVVFWLIFAVALYVLSALFLRKIFQKAGVANPNVAWIPIYNVLLFVKLGDINPLILLAGFGASILLGWIPVIGFIIGLVPTALYIMAAYRVNLKLQKDPVPWTIFAALLSIVWLGVIAFGKGVWNTASAPAAGLTPPPAPPWASQGWLMDTTTWGGVPFQGYAVTPPSAPPAAPPAA